MITKAVLRYIRISPRKFRLVIPLVKGKRAEEAVAILASMNQKAASYGIDLINHAIANTRRMQGVEVSDLYVSKLIADGGPQLKRFRAASMGRASPIRKRTSHLTVELDTIKKPEQQAKAAAVKKGSRVQEPGARHQEAQSGKISKTKTAHKAEPAKKGKG
jgi:large subunit ribosomal protein L22